MEVREMRDTDLDILKTWFEDETLANNIALLPLEEWYRNTSRMQNYYIYMTCIDGLAVGNVIVQVIDDWAAISVFVDPLRKRRGYGKESIESVLRLPEVVRRLDKVRRVVAGIDPDNTASIRCFESCGFTYENSDEDGFLNYVKLVHPVA